MFTTLILEKMSIITLLQTKDAHQGEGGRGV